MKNRQNAGRCIAIAGFVVLGVNAVLSYSWGMSHSEHMHDAAQYVGLWPSSLAVALAVTGITVLLSSGLSISRRALISLVAVLIVGVPRLLTDPRCLANITTEHGCHTFMASMMLVIAGAVLMFIPARK